MPPVSTYRVNGPALRAIREDRDLTLRQLAQRLGPHRHPQGIRKYETEDGKAMGQDYAKQIARVLKVHVSRFTDAPAPAEDDKETEPVALPDVA